LFFILSITIQSGVGFRDGDRVNKFISSNVETLTGYPPQNLLDDWYFWHRQITHLDDRTTVQKFSAHLNTGQSAELEYRVVRADGQVIWVRDSAKSEKLADKVIVYGVISDITVRKQAEMERKKLLVTTRQTFVRLADSTQLLKETTQIIRNVLDDLRSPVLDTYGLLAPKTVHTYRTGLWTNWTSTICPVWCGLPSAAG